ncbi:MAG TPA: hypothetical protein V6C96_00550 [Vampirovibrionales bacterium]
MRAFTAPVQRFFILAFLFLSIALCFSHASFSGQNPVINQIIHASKECQPNILFTPSILNINESELLIADKLSTFATKTSSQIILEATRDLRLMPLSACVLRSNKDYYQEKYTQLFQDLKVTKVVNLDFLAHAKIQNKHKGSLYVFAPINPIRYPQGESFLSFMHALNAIEEAKPKNKVLLVCYNNRHRNSLISAIYQFLMAYSQEPFSTCEKVGTEEDKFWNAAQEIANEGLFIYDMPLSYKKFYKDLTESVCNESSDEFLKELSQVK